jgi:hypothetical protein
MAFNCSYGEAKSEIFSNDLAKLQRNLVDFISQYLLLCNETQLSLGCIVLLVAKHRAKTASFFNCFHQCALVFIAVLLWKCLPHSPLVYVAPIKFPAIEGGVDPYTWFKDILARIADHPITRLAELLPHNCMAAQARSQIHTRRTDRTAIMNRRSAGNKDIHPLEED